MRGQLQRPAHVGRDEPRLTRFQQDPDQPACEIVLNKDRGWDATYNLLIWLRVRLLPAGRSGSWFLKPPVIELNLLSWPILMFLFCSMSPST